MTTTRSPTSRRSRTSRPSSASSSAPPASRPSGGRAGHRLRPPALTRRAAALRPPPQRGRGGLFRDLGLRQGQARRRGPRPAHARHPARRAEGHAVASRPDPRASSCSCSAPRHGGRRRGRPGLLGRLQAARRARRPAGDELLGLAAREVGAQRRASREASRGLQSQNSTTSPEPTSTTSTWSMRSGEASAAGIAPPRRTSSR